MILMILAFSWAFIYTSSLVKGYELVSAANNYI